MKRLWMILMTVLALGAMTVGSAFALEASTPAKEELHLHRADEKLVANSDFTVTKFGNLTTGSDVTFTVEGGTVSRFEISMESDWYKEEGIRHLVSI